MWLVKNARKHTNKAWKSIQIPHRITDEAIALGPVRNGIDSEHHLGDFDGGFQPFLNVGSFAVGSALNGTLCQLIVHLTTKDAGPFF